MARTIPNSSSECSPGTLHRPQPTFHRSDWVVRIFLVCTTFTAWSGNGSLISAPHLLPAIPAATQAWSGNFFAGADLKARATAAITPLICDMRFAAVSKRATRSKISDSVARKIYESVPFYTVGFQLLDFDGQ